MDDLQIREADPRDADQIAQVHVRSWQAAYRGLISQEVLDTMSVAKRAETWSEIIATPAPLHISLLVAERGDRVIGWASLGAGRDPGLQAQGEVYGIYVDPDEWSTGCGHALLLAAEQRIAEAGHDTAYLWVLDGNSRADTFYARHGWTEDGSTKTDERAGFTLLEHRRVKSLREAEG